MRFKYTASQSDGKLIEGQTEAQSMAELLAFLASRGLKPISVEKLKGIEKEKIRKFFGQRITTIDKIFLTKYLALMLKLGIDLFRAVDILIADFEKKILKVFLSDIRSALEKGQPFYSVFERYPQYFSPVFVNLIKAGETSGNLERVFEDLSVNLERERNLQNKIRSALFYPIMLLVLSFLILVFLTTFAIPKIADVFLSVGIQPPLFSQIVFSVGLFLKRYIGVIAGLIIISGTAGWLFVFKTVSGRKFLIKILSTAPLIKNIVNKISLQRFAVTLSSLLKSGMPIINALETTADTLAQPNFRMALKNIAQKGLAKGLTLGEAFKKETAFPSLISNTIAISEKSGQLDEILKTLANFYESEIDSSLKTLVSFIEPLLLLIIGSVIGLIAISIIIPIYQLVGRF